MHGKCLVVEQTGYLAQNGQQYTFVWGVLQTVAKTQGPACSSQIASPGCQRIGGERGPIEDEAFCLVSWQNQAKLAAGVTSTAHNVNQPWRLFEHEHSVIFTLKSWKSHVNVFCAPEIPLRIMLAVFLPSYTSWYVSHSSRRKPPAWRWVSNNLPPFTLPGMAHP